MLKVTQGMVPMTENLRDLRNIWEVMGLGVTLLMAIDSVREHQASFYEVSAHGVILQIITDGSEIVLKLVERI